MRNFEPADVEKTLGAIPLEELQRRKRERDLDQCAGQMETAANRVYGPKEVVDELFRYHAPTETTIPKFGAINQAAKNFAEVILANCPGGPARVNAIEFIVLARMLANQAIAVNGLALSY